MLERESEPRFLLPDGEEDAHFSDASTCIRVEALPEGELRLLVANFVLRKPLKEE